MNEPIIDITRLKVNAAGREILALEKLTVHPGEVLTVLGPNGAGKSTLLKTILGFERIRYGQVTVLGEDVASLTAAGLCRLRRHIGYMPQLLFGGDNPLTVREVVAMGRSGIVGLFRRLSRNDHRLIDEWLERLNLKELASRRFCDCSGGEQRRAIIARAMAQQPSVLLLDEPTANLDLPGRETVIRTLQQLYRTHHITIVLICHELDVIPPCCKRVLMLKNGLPFADGLPQDVLTDEKIAAFYGPSFRVIQRAGRYVMIPAGQEVMQ